KIKRIGIITAGGDSPGLNAAIRGVGKATISDGGMEVVGFRDGFRGLAEDLRLRLDKRTLSGILTVGGTILGTSRDKPHRMEFDGAQLFAKLEAFLAEAKTAEIVQSVLVDGSFVTAKTEPNDIDLILVVGPDHDLDADLSPLRYGVLSKRRVHRRHGFDLLVASADSAEYRRYL